MRNIFNTFWLITAFLNPTSANYEVFAFVLKTNPETWIHFDWKKLTTIVLVGFHDADLVRHAHSHDVKAVAIANIAKNRLTDATYRHKWIKDQVNYAQQHNLDGVNVDFEEPIDRDSPESRGYTKLIQGLSNAMHASIPGSQVSVDVAWSPHCVDGRCYDYKALATAVDLVFVMGYDEQSQMWNDTSCKARANAPLVQTVMGVQEYLKLGIPASKLVLGVPWYGYVYPCLRFDPETDTCFIESVPFRGCQCSDAAGKEKPYQELIAISSKVPGGIKWQKSTFSSYFNVQDASSKWHQVWLDTPRSLRLKYYYSNSILGLKGIGFWTINFLDYSNATQVEAMWSIVPSL